MTGIELIKILGTFSAAHAKRTFRLKELAVFTGESSAAVGMALIRAARVGTVARVRNLWINMLAPPTLEEIAFELKSVSYISFESALYKSGALSQSPRGALTLATTGRSAALRTPLGDVIFTHLSKRLFFGFDDKRWAIPEKAFLDMVYIRIRKGTYKAMSEVFYPETFDWGVLQKLARRFPEYVKKELAKIA